MFKGFISGGSGIMVYLTFLFFLFLVFTGGIVIQLWYTFSEYFYFFKTTLEIACNMWQFQQPQKKKKKKSNMWQSCN